MKDTMRMTLAALLALPIGCGKGMNSTDMGEMSYSSANLESGNCGQDKDAANPSTGDAEEDADSAANADTEADDDSGEGDEGTMRSLIARPKHVILQVLWGNLLGGSPSASTTWNGKVSVTGDAKVKLLRSIRFESNDAIASETETEIAWTSSTRPSYDGVQILVGLPDNAASASFTLETAPYSVTYTADALVRLRALTTIGTDGNAVSIRALPLARCQHGFMRGKWTRVDEKGGIFRGQWIRANGKAKGFVEGIWGARLSGEAVFFGRIVSRDGKNRGTVFGHYEAGMFRGHWARNGKVRGVIRGHASEGSVSEAGFFAGEWLRFCSAYKRCEASVDASASATAAVAASGNATDIAIEASGEVAVTATCQ